MHIRHELLADGAVSFRGYQANLARIASEQDTLVVLPTGLGKTIVAVLAVADSLRDGAQKILFMAPTKPLAEQHGETLRTMFAAPWNSRVHVLSGHIKPEDRTAVWLMPGIIVATPQVVHNDLLAGRLKANEFDLVVFDEAHRAVGDYPYVFIGQTVLRERPQTRRLGLTASPGHDIARIDEVRANLGLGHVEIRTTADPDVKEYVQDVEMEWESFPMPPGVTRVTKRLQDCLSDRVRRLKELGVLQGAGGRPSRRQLLDAVSRIQAQIRSHPSPDSKWYSGLSLQAQAMKLSHAIDLVETQGATVFLDYAARLDEEQSKAAHSITHDKRFQEAVQIARHADEANPKLERTATLMAEGLGEAGKAIVFAQYRSTCERIVERLGQVPGARPVLFVGQAKKDGTGMSQKEQQATIQAFRDREHNVLVATSVAEEGLDIPQTDLVVFYEPIPSEIRSIQRRGRTGRNQAGRVVVLMTKGTQDEAAHWIAKRKERQMVQELQSLRQRLTASPRAARPTPQRTLDEAGGPPSGGTPGEAASGQQVNHNESAPEPAPLHRDGPRIVMDSREQSGGIARHLHAAGARLENRSLDVGDFVLSDRVVVERKTTEDFVESLLDNRLFEQAKALSQYPKPFLLLEGEDLRAHRGIREEAVLGALASLAVDYGVPVLRSRDGEESARWLLAMARREQGRGGRKVAVRAGAKANPEDRPIDVLCAFPGINTLLARRLLQRFGCVRAVLGASLDDLASVKGVGEAKARTIHEVADMTTSVQANGGSP